MPYIKLAYPTSTHNSNVRSPILQPISIGEPSPSVAAFFDIVVGLVVITFIHHPIPHLLVRQSRYSLTAHTARLIESPSPRKLKQEVRFLGSVEPTDVPVRIQWELGIAIDE
jgi:hypothetical protein